MNIEPIEEFTPAKVALFIEKVYGPGDEMEHLEKAHALKVGMECLSYTMDATTLVVGHLHDVYEDGYATEAEIQDEFNYEVAEKVVALARQKDETYNNYIKRLIDSNDFSLLIVKLADLNVNLKRSFSSGISEGKLNTLVKRYLPARDSIELKLMKMIEEKNKGGEHGN